MEQGFKMLREIKSVVISSVKDGVPQSRIIDIMHYDEGGVYFITSVTKPFYRQLMANNKVAITGMTKECVQVRLVGEVEKLSQEMLEDIFKKNPALIDLFPGENKVFFPFYLSKGKGEIFDLSGKNEKMNRVRFAFGGDVVNASGCTITDNCIECGKCKDICPFDAIKEGTPFIINPRKCDECGLCHSVCPVDAIELPKGL